MGAMNYRVFVTERARSDIENALRYIRYSLKNPEAARAALNAVDSALSGLARMPERYPLADDSLLSAWGIRFADVKSYLLFYRVDKNASSVYALRFLYGKSDWASVLRRDIPNDETLAAFKEIEDGLGHHFSGTTEDFIAKMLED